MNNTDSILRTTVLHILCGVMAGTLCVESAFAQRRMPPLVLGNRRDRCDTIISAEPEQCEDCLPSQVAPPCDDCAPYIVPPLYLPSDPEPISPRAPTPTPADEPPQTPQQPEAPSPPDQDEQPEFAKPAEPGNVFSEDSAQGLDALNSLLNKLQEHFRDVATAVPSPEESDEPTAEAAEPLNEPDAAEEHRAAPDSTEASPPPESKDNHASNSSEPPSGSASVPPAEPKRMQPRPTRPVEKSDSVSLTDPRRNDAQSPPDPLQSGALAWIHQTAAAVPVDRIALADNLYAAGETNLAINVYSEIDVQTLSEVDRSWIQFQLAGCYRRMGDVDEASKHYRKVVAADNSEWMVGMARWWLMALDKRRSMVQEADQWESTIRMLKEQVRDEIKR